MLTLKSLTFENIGRFVESQTIDFTSLGFLVQVDAINNNTGGSSGAGKSTVFKALEFLLGLNDISNSILQSRLTKEHMLVSGQFDLDGVPVRIERGKKLLIDINGEITTGSSKITEEVLDQIIGMPRDLFRQILHKRQNEGGFFLHMAPSEVHKFLTSCLGLDKEQTKIVTLDKRLEELFSLENDFKTVIGSIKSAISATKTAFSSLGSRPILEMDPETISTLTEAHKEASNNRLLCLDAHKKEMEALEKGRPQITITPFDRTRIEQYENQINGFKNKILELERADQNHKNYIGSKISDLKIQSNKLENAELTRQSDVKNKISTIKAEILKIEQVEKDRQNSVKSSILTLQSEILKNKPIVDQGLQARLDATELARQLNIVRTSICPTCRQGWINDACKEKENEILAKLSECKKIVINGTEADKKILAINEQLKALKLESEPRLTSETDSLRQSIIDLEIQIKPLINPETLVIKENIALLENELNNRLLPEVIEFNKLLSITELMLAAERKLEIDYQHKETEKSRSLLDEYTKIEKSHREKYDDLSRSLLKIEREALHNLEEAKNKVANFEEARARFEDSEQRLKVQQELYSLDLSTKELKLAELQEEIELATELKKAIKSYLSCSFEDALNSIGDRATRFIRSIPNMGTATIQFEGLKETKEGKIKEEVVCSVSIDGEIGIPIKSLSGGERSSTDLAIDLSVIKFIEETTGKGIDLFILDEAFLGMDTKNIIEAIEMLKECSLDKRLLIVDHNSEATQFMENRLTVVRDGLTSRILSQ